MLSKDILIKEYVDNQLTTKQIAKKYSCGVTSIKRWIKKYNIPVNNSKRNIKSKTVLTRSFLSQHYTVLGKSCAKIAKEVGMTSATVSRALTRHNIAKRKGTRKGVQNIKPKIKDELSGQTFHDLTVIKYVRGGWLCQCKCGNTKIYQTKRLTYDGVKSCGCRNKKHGSEHHFWKGYGEIPQSLYGKYFNHAEDRGLIFDVTIEYLWNIFVQQNKKCALSGVYIGFTKNNVTASLDRVDPSKGYIEGNLQWLHKDINQMKWNFSQDTFIKWCELVYKSRHLLTTP